MNKIAKIVLIVLGIGSLGTVVFAYLNQDVLHSWLKYLQSDTTGQMGFVRSDMVQNGSQGNEPATGDAIKIVPAEDLSIQVESIVQGLSVPWSVVFTDPNRILITEREGAVRVVQDGALQEQPLIRFDEVSSVAEEGLMGMTLDPNYEENKYVYVCFAYPKDDGLVDAVIRLTDQGDRLERDQTIIDDIPAARFHAGCELGFGPDGMLYITTGDATDRTIAQDRDSLGGKILRINADGSVPDDNPFPNSPIFSLGHRNPQGIAWHPVTGRLYSTEHGPSNFDGPPGGDEVNLIAAGENYGWPRVSHQETDPEFVDPLLVFTPAVAPGSAMFHDGTGAPQLTNNFFFAGLKGEGVYRAIFDESDPSQVLLSEKIPQVDVGRVREVMQGPDGAIYITTSNRDGRATPRPGDDALYKITVQ